MSLKSFFAIKKGIIIVGALIGILAPVLQKLGNPGNMGICVACFERDIAGALGFHRASVVQYLRPEILVLVLGSLVAYLIYKEFRPRTGSASLVRFVLGIIAMIGALVFLGCPWRALFKSQSHDLFKKVFLLLFLVLVLGYGSKVWAIEVYKKNNVSLSLGIWSQFWYQYCSNYDTDNDGKQDDDLNDFMIRRIYLAVKGQVVPFADFFFHFASDRLGQEDLDKPSKGLGSGVAIRDAWVRLKILNDDIMLQMGRMYVPFTRNYGTTSTKALLTLDLDWGQGGVRSGIFYPQNVGRDDSITLWGNILHDKLQYRFMIGDGSEEKSINPEDNLRFAGRISYNFFDPEKSWFNPETYLGKKKILAVGFGGDYQKDLVLNGKEKDYYAWTGDVHFDYPLKDDALTLQLSYIRGDNIVNPITWTNAGQGDDIDIYSGKIGYFFSQKLGYGQIHGQIQPFCHYSYIDVDKEKDTQVYGFGFNYYIKGYANKISAEITFVDQEKETSSLKDHTLFTFQIAFGL